MSTHTENLELKQSKLKKRIQELTIERNNLLEIEKEEDEILSKEGILSEDELMGKFGIFYQMNLMNKAAEPFEGMTGDEFKIGTLTMIGSMAKKYTVKDFFKELRFKKKKFVDVEPIVELHKRKRSIKVDIAKRIKKKLPVSNQEEIINRIDNIIEKLKNKTND